MNDLATDVDLTIARLLCTRLCHDMSGPIGAISAGVELMVEGGDPTFHDETLALLRHSSDAASARLRFLRAAFGVGGSHGGVSSLQGLVEGYVDALSGQAIRLVWRQPPETDVDGDAGQILLLLCLIGLDCLGGDGGIDVTIASLNRVVSLSVVATGRNVRLPETLQPALGGNVEVVNVRTVQHALAGRLSRSYGGIRAEEADGRVLLSATVSASVV